MAKAGEGEVITRHFLHSPEHLWFLPYPKGMSVAKVIEVTSESATSFQDAVEQGILRVTETVDHVEGAWIKDQKVLISEGKTTGYRVMMKVTFVLTDTLQA
ncbi:MAG: hypothetical protein HONBIEJF_03045 [Fimbriimonadaceae bacterium]|nr:hypothetical protein [Fimbriimonadaceae bacterium]